MHPGYGPIRKILYIWMLVAWMTQDHNGTMRFSVPLCAVAFSPPFEYATKKELKILNYLFEKQGERKGGRRKNVFISF